MKGRSLREKLTPRRKDILSFISEFLEEKGYPPSVREIGEAVGFASASSVHAHLSVLARDGYI
ncbi:MAG: repressor LexA, partial [Acidimicrobiales bacterium]|nr:repressor LexA [Acidimicrobiales bacterium]